MKLRFLGILQPRNCCLNSTRQCTEFDLLKAAIRLPRHLIEIVPNRVADLDYVPIVTGSI